MVHTVPDTVAHPSVDHESGVVTIARLPGLEGGYSPGLGMVSKQGQTAPGLLECLQTMLGSQSFEGQGWRRVLPKSGAGFPSGDAGADAPAASRAPVEGDD